MIKCITILARRRREKIISFTLDKDETLIWSLWPWNHLLAWGGSEMLSRRGGQKMASRGGRPAIHPPTHTHGPQIDQYVWSRLS